MQNLKTPTETSAIISRSVRDLHAILALLKINAADLNTTEWIALKTARLMLKELLNILERLERSLQ